MIALGHAGNTAADLPRASYPRGCIMRSRSETLLWHVLLPVRRRKAELFPILPLLPSADAARPPSHQCHIRRAACQPMTAVWQRAQSAAPLNISPTVPPRNRAQRRLASAPPPCIATVPRPPRHTTCCINPRPYPTLRTAGPVLPLRTPAAWTSELEPSGMAVPTRCPPPCPLVRHPAP